MHASKPDSKYVNNLKSYRALCDIVARGRIDGHIPWESIDDDTRPVNQHNAFWNSRQFLDQSFRQFLRGYWRNKQQSQPSHIEIIGEKLTVQSILKPVAKEYNIPLTISRGMCSLPAKKAIADRFERSGKEDLVLLIVSDLDPAGETIAEDFATSFARDFDIHESHIQAYKVALTIDPNHRPGQRARTRTVYEGERVESNV